MLLLPEKNCLFLVELGCSGVARADEALKSLKQPAEEGG